MSVRSSSRRLVIGASGSGKSYYCKRQVDRLPRSRPVLVWDPEAEWAGPRATDGIRGALTFESTAALREWLRALEARPRSWARLVVQSRSRDRAADLSDLARLAHDAGDLTLVIDEAHQFARAAVLPEALRYLMQVSRHRRVDLVLVAQRPTGLAPDLRDNATETVLFRMPGEASRDWVRATFGASVAEALTKLDRGACIRA